MKLISSLFIVVYAAAVSAGGPTKEKTPPGPIKNFVVLCLENHSFDSLLGWWAKGKQGIDGIPSGDAACNIDSKNKIKYCASNNATFIQKFDPEHQVDPTVSQIYGLASTNASQPIGKPTMSGFVDNAIFVEDAPGNPGREPEGLTDADAAQTVMSSFDPAKLPVTIALAEEYTVFDAWHSAIPGPTFPNRVFLMSGTSNGLFRNDPKKLIQGMSQKSIFQMVADAGYTYKNYYDQVPTGFVFNDFKVQFAKDVLEGNWGRHIGSLNVFERDAANGELPHFSWIDPVLVSLPGEPANDNHPPHNIARGEALVKRIYHALRNSPQWQDTALLLTYDEHGGFWDHVAPAENVPVPDANSQNCPEFHFDRLGVRVPTMLISPWAKKGGFIHKPVKPASAKFSQYAPTEYDHSSLLHTVQDLWGLDKSVLTPRAEWSGSFSSELLSSPRTDCLADLPDAPDISVADELDDIDNEWTEVVSVIRHGL
ncbi:phosphoesterase [Chytriomyces sp. MP71]|nr:phosphoesterase [Chytriomyces sp. MP71]